MPEPDIVLKRCPSCRRTLKADTIHFFKCLPRKDGLSVYCKNCAARKQTAKAAKARGVKRKKIAHAPKKRCSICRKTFKRTSEFFYRSKSMHDGLQSRCKVCDKKAATKWVRENKVQARRHQDKHAASQCGISIRKGVRDRLREMAKLEEEPYSDLLVKLMNRYEEL